MYAVALTGGIGSGKSTVADRFGALGAGLVDSDVLAHELTRPDGAALPAIVATFGESMLAPDGSLDRTAMRELAFTDATARSRLEAILHPMIRTASMTRAQSLAASCPYVMFVIPLLAESLRGAAPGSRAHDRILVVDCDPAVQIARVMARSALAESQVRAIMAAQAGRAERLAIADDVIDNSTDIGALEGPVRRLHDRYILAASRGSSGSPV
ncbi:dephospho-CoA kinase [soil metagenome]